MDEKITPELMEKATAAGSPEEIMALAKENGVELTAEAARAYYDQLHKTGELSDDELDAVAGGSGCKGDDPYDELGRMLVKGSQSCPYWVCSVCSGEKSGDHSKCRDGGSFVRTTCEFCLRSVRRDSATYICNHNMNQRRG